MIMAYKLDVVDFEDMDGLALPEYIEQDNSESNKNISNDFSTDALDIYDSYYEW